MQGDMCHSPRLTPTCGSGHFSGQVYSASVDRMQEHRDTTPSESASVSMLIYTYCSTKPKSLLHVPSPPFLSFVFLPSTKAQLTLHVDLGTALALLPEWSAGGSKSHSRVEHSTKRMYTEVPLVQLDQDLACMTFNQQMGGNELWLLSSTGGFLPVQ